MKVKMKIKYRKLGLFMIGVAFLLTLLVLLAVAFITEDHNYALAILCLLLGVVILVATYFRFNYGITITEKRVVAIEQAGIKILRYDDVSSIVVKFTDESVVAYIRMKNQKEYTFVWDSIFLGTNVILPSHNKIKLYDEWVEKSIANLSKCPKVKIQNFYSTK
jgi:NADH:ubiquinone oxidoreductase subunit 2 (subunit N)